MTSARRWIAVWLFVAAAMVGAWSGAGVGHAASHATVDMPAAPCVASEETTEAGAGVHHAGLVIVFLEGRTETYCIEFAEEEISGVELLRRSGLPVVFSGFGGLGSGVCRIDDVGCSDPGDCFCQCRGADCAYWSYFALDGGEWQILNAGASQRRLRDGDADGWVWGDGRSPPGDTGEVCPLAVPAEPLPVASLTPRPPSGSTPPRNDPPSAGGDEPVAPGLAASNDQRSSTAEPAAARAEATAQPTQGPRVVRRTDGAEAGQPEEGAAADYSGGGAPVGLIAFGAVAAVLVAGIGAVALRRRFGG